MDMNLGNLDTLAGTSGAAPMSPPPMPAAPMENGSGEAGRKFQAVLMALTNLGQQHPDWQSDLAPLLQAGLRILQQRQIGPATQPGGGTPIDAGSVAAQYQ